MAPRDRPPFRADHVGSLLRPPALMHARADRAEGRIDADELRMVEDDAIREAVAMQRDAGLRSATDGEFRRASWHMDFIYQLGGVSQVEGERIHVKFRIEDAGGGPAVWFGGTDLASATSVTVPSKTPVTVNVTLP